MYKKYVDEDRLKKDEDYTMDANFADRYEKDHLNTEYLAVETIAEDPCLKKLAETILEDAIRLKATDIQISSYSEEYGIVKYQTGIYFEPYRLVRNGAMRGLVLTYMKQSDGVTMKRWSLPQHGALSHEYKETGEKYALRTSFLPSEKGCKMNVSIRVLYASVLGEKVENLGYPDEVLGSLNEVLNMNQGLVLFTGGTGSGKTTSMYTGILDIINRFKGGKNIITIEDPVEYLIDGVVQTSVDEELGRTFGVQLSEVLKQKPNVILLGEMSTESTAQTAIRAATSGHLVFSTFHTDHILDIQQGLNYYNVNALEFTNAVELVVNQVLEAKLCPKCKKVDLPTTEEHSWITKLGTGDTLASVYRKGNDKNCPLCEGSGYHGRVLICSMLDANREYTRIALEYNTRYEIERELLASDNARYYRLEEDVFRHLRDGNIDLDTAHRVIR